MFKNCEEIIRKYVTICTVISLMFFGLIGSFAIIGLLSGEGEETIIVLLFSILFGLLSFVIGAFLYGFADMIENSKLQSELLLDIRKKLSNEKCNEVPKNEM